MKKNMHKFNRNSSRAARNEHWQLPW